MACLSPWGGGGGGGGGGGAECSLAEVEGVLLKIWGEVAYPSYFAYFLEF
jgi:hypothetical protein